MCHGRRSDLSFSQPDVASSRGASNTIPSVQITSGNAMEGYDWQSRSFSHGFYPGQSQDVRCNHQRIELADHLRTPCCVAGRSQHATLSTGRSRGKIIGKHYDPIRRLLRSSRPVIKSKLPMGHPKIPSGPAVIVVNEEPDITRIGN